MRRSRGRWKREIPEAFLEDHPPAQTGLGSEFQSRDHSEQTPDEHERRRDVDSGSVSWPHRNLPACCDAAASGAARRRPLARAPTKARRVITRSPHPPGAEATAGS